MKWQHAPVLLALAVLAAGQTTLDLGTQSRSFVSLMNRMVAFGTGLMTITNGPYLAVQVDTTVIGLRVAVPAMSSTPCVQGTWAAGGGFHYDCVAANVWQRATEASW